MHMKFMTELHVCLRNTSLSWYVNFCFNSRRPIITSLYFQDYSEMSVAYRPSHADATYDMKYGVRSVQVLISRVIIRWKVKILWIGICWPDSSDFNVCNWRVVVDLQLEKPLEELHQELLQRKFWSNLQELRSVLFLMTWWLSLLLVLILLAMIPELYIKILVGSVLLRCLFFAFDTFFKLKNMPKLKKFH